MTSQTPLRHQHWEVINRAELDVCTPNSFGDSKTQKTRILFVNIDQRGPTAGPRAIFGPQTNFFGTRIITVISVIMIGLNIAGISRFRV